MQEHATLSRPTVTPPRVLALALAFVGVLIALPPAWLAPVQGGAFAALQPGQRAANALVAIGRRGKMRLRSHFSGATALTKARSEAARLASENELLTEQVRALRRRLAAAEAMRPAADRALLRIGGVEARVLGQQARSYVIRQKLLDAGSLDGIEPGALVLHGAALVDRGKDQGVQSGHLVLGTGRVWGRVVRAGPTTSVVRTLTAPDFRDVVRLRNPRGTQGILEGTGEPLCRIRMVAVTEPASVGDEVFAASLLGLDAPVPRYGVIERVEQPVGAAHWDLWMRPALTGPPPENVVVVRVEP